MPNNILAQYPYILGAYDEMFDEKGKCRLHWKEFLDHLMVEDARVMSDCIHAVYRQVCENGVTYNVYDDSKGTQRLWDLNILPLVIPHEEWVGIEEAISQRASLLNHILVDVYGEQKILKDGALPSALVYGNAGFLRPAHGIRHINGIALHLYAADLARDSNGKWWVVADRTQAPSGAGYALENRLIISRVFPDLFRDLKVRGLVDFFTTMRDSLMHWGQLCVERGMIKDKEPPLVVLLTPGPYNETYYEHSFLSRHLGFPLVEGGDLTVRDGAVWLKTLSGLRRVHVILRRVDDDYCDSLELRNDSSLGVAGLTEVARNGNVIIANSLGSNLLESGALLGFLPSLCEKILGQKLKMPSVATWWCGESAALEQVIQKFDQLIIKPSFPQLRQFPVFGRDMTGQERQEFINKVRSNPQNFIAQEIVNLSHAPVWNAESGGGLSSCAMGLRVYACATPNGYVIMPGGLTRVATGSDARILNMQRGGSSKDTWVQTDPALETPILFKHKIINEEIVRSDISLSSRMAENLFWFGRYSQRCDNIARLTRVTLDFLLHSPLQFRGEEWNTVQNLCAWFRLIDANSFLDFHSQLNDAQIESDLLLTIVRSDIPGIARDQQKLYQTASHLRERLSSDHWRILNQMLQEIHHVNYPPSLSDGVRVLDQIILYLMTLAGFALDSMTRDKGWRFLSIGRRIERLQFQSIVLQRALTICKNGDLNWLLELSDSTLTYRARYVSEPEWLPVLSFLMLDDSNPHSVLFQLNGILDYIEKLAQNYEIAFDGELANIRRELLTLKMEQDLETGNVELLNLLSKMNVAGEALSAYLSERFFSYTNQRVYHG